MYLLRINGEKLDAEQKQYLKRVFGSELKIAHSKPLPQNPLEFLKMVREKLPVVAVEAPLYILARLLPNRQELAIKFIMPVFRRDENDAQQFSHYEEIISITQEVFGEYTRISLNAKPLKL